MTGHSVPQLRIAMTLPSAASLGSYQAGAVAALLVALQCLNTRADDAGLPQPVVADAVGGASAGAVVGLLATRCLVGGLDPVHVLHRAWVHEASWRRLRRGAHDAPLSLTQIERSARRLLDPRDRQQRGTYLAPPAARQRQAVVLHLDVGCLQGLTFPIRGRGPVIEALTHVDSSEFVFRPGDGPHCWSTPAGRSALDVAFAAMSHPAVFAPRLLDRSDETDRYRQRGITNPPASGHQWYADGGALVRNPLAGTLHAARRVAPPPVGDGDQNGLRRTRVHLLVHPHTAAPSDDGRWADPDRRPRWTSTLSRVVACLDQESLYADQRRIEDVNTRLHWAHQLTDTLAPLLPPEAQPALTDLLARMRADTGAGAGEIAHDGNLPSALAQAVLAAGGVLGKEPVATEVISPVQLLEDSGDPPPAGAGLQAAVPEVLAGEFLGRFGGLLDRRTRHSDFVTGWSSTRAWLAESLPRHGLPQAEVDAALAAVDARGIRYGRGGPRGRTGLADLPLRQRAQLAGTVLRAAHVALRDTLLK